MFSKVPALMKRFFSDKPLMLAGEKQVAVVSLAMAVVIIIIVVINDM
jgi:hypothetical protein